MGKHAEIVKEATTDLVEIVGGVLVGHVGGCDVQLEVRSVVLKVVVVREFCWVGWGIGEKNEGRRGEKGGLG